MQCGDVDQLTLPDDGLVRPKHVATNEIENVILMTFYEFQMSL
jgi:hypothetical protein